MTTTEQEVQIAYEIFKEAQRDALMQADKLEKEEMSEEVRAAEVETLKDLVAEMECAHDYYAALCQMPIKGAKSSGASPKMVDGHVH